MQTLGEFLSESCPTGQDSLSYLEMSLEKNRPVSANKLQRYICAHSQTPEDF